MIALRIVHGTDHGDRGGPYHATDKLDGARSNAQTVGAGIFLDDGGLMDQGDGGDGNEYRGEDRPGNVMDGARVVPT